MVYDRDRCVLVYLTSDGRISSVNEQFTRYFGFPTISIAQRPFSSIICPSVLDKKYGNPEHLGVYPFQTRILTAWGTGIDVTLFPLRETVNFAGLRDFLITFHSPDVSEPAGLSTPDVFRQVFEKAAIGVAIVSPEGVILRANSAFEDYLGYSQAELQKLTFPEFTHKDDIDKDVQYYSQLKAGEIDDYQMEKRYITKDQRVIWVHLSVSLLRDANGKEVNAIAVIKDIDKRKRMEIELRDHKIRFERAFSGAREAVWHWLDVNSDELWWSPSLYEILGYSGNEIKPNSSAGVKEFLHPDDKKKVLKAVKNHLYEAESFDTVFRLKTREGHYKWVNARGVAERDESGKPTEMIGIVADIDEIKKAQELIKEHYLALENSNKELENFAYVASHDLQEPLRTISSFLQLFELSLDAPVNDVAASYLATVQKASLRMRSLIDDLLEYSRVGSIVEIEYVEVDALLNEVLSDLTASIESSEGLIVRKRLYAVKGDKNMLYRLFKNLISNAIKFRRPGCSPEIVIDSRIVKSRVVYTVADNGIGIREEYYDRVFEVFKRLHTREEYPGSGIGLSVCKKIVGLHSGDIAVNSDLQRGSTFTFDLQKH